MIRPARENEIDALCAAITSMDPWLKLKITADDLSRGLRADTRRTVTVYEENNTILGAAITRVDAAEMLFFFRWGPKLAAHYGVDWPCESNALPPAAYLGSLAVFPGAQGKGVGSLLLDDAERRARNAGLDRLYLMVTDRNTRAREFYLQKGYTAIAYLDDCIQPGNREWLMKKLLD